MAAQREEDFRPSSGRFVGLAGLAAALGLVVVSLLDPSLGLPAWAYAAAVLAGVLVWAALLRPRVWVGDGFLVLRTMFETVELPLASVDSVVVRQVLVVVADGRRYTSPALGRARRALVRSDAGRAPRGGGGGVGAAFGLGGLGGRLDAGAEQPRALGVDYAAYVESRLVERTTRGRTEAATRPTSPEAHAVAAGVRRHPAWPEIVLVALSLVVTLGLGLLG